MPIYEFRCISCDKVTEKICVSNITEIDCPTCGTKAERIVSVFSGQTNSPNGSTSGCMPGSGFT